MVCLKIAKRSEDIAEAHVSGEMDSVYPTQYETEVLLKDGSRMMFRPIRRGDIEQKG
ncbi:MAG: hypothetical protein JRJ85_23950 [Deltaproteobacteria bacterium]|nr:hypothetical protein [Deltaproteobacteria bacterium]